MKTRFFITLAAVIVTIGIAVVFVIDGIYFDNILTRGGFSANQCQLIRGENDTFYVVKDCRFEPFKPIKPVASLYSLDVTQKFHNAMRIREACIPVSGFDVDEIAGTLVIYLTEENASVHTAAISDTVDMPYVIRTTENPAREPDAWRNARCLVWNLFDESLI